MEEYGNSGRETVAAGDPSLFNTTAVEAEPSANIPDIYADGVTVRAGYAGFTLTFSLSMGETADPLPVAVVRVSPQQALVTALVLKKILRSYQDEIGPLLLPDSMYDALNIDREL